MKATPPAAESIEKSHEGANSSHFDENGTKSRYIGSRKASLKYVKNKRKNLIETIGQIQKWKQLVHKKESQLKARHSRMNSMKSFENGSKSNRVNFKQNRPSLNDEFSSLERFNHAPNANNFGANPQNFHLKKHSNGLVGVTLAAKPPAAAPSKGNTNSNLVAFSQVLKKNQKSRVTQRGLNDALVSGSNIPMPSSNTSLPSIDQPHRMSNRNLNGQMMPQHHLRTLNY